MPSNCKGPLKSVTRRTPSGKSVTYTRCTSTSGRRISAKKLSYISKLVDQVWSDAERGDWNGAQKRLNNWTVTSKLFAPYKARLFVAIATKDRGKLSDARNAITGLIVDIEAEYRKRDAGE